MAQYIQAASAISCQYCRQEASKQVSGKLPNGVRVNYSNPTSYGKTVSSEVLVECIKIQQELIREVKEKNGVLERQISELKEKNSVLEGWLQQLTEVMRKYCDNQKKVVGKVNNVENRTFELEIARSVEDAITMEESPWKPTLSQAQSYN